MSGTKTLRWAWGLTLAFAVLRLWFVGHIDLAPDEAYYWEWSRHPALSYYDQGPMLAWAIRLGTSLLGQTVLGVRLMAVLCGVIISGLAIHALRRELGRPQAALWAVLAFNTLLLFSVGAVLMMHDSLMGAFWMLGLVAALKALRDPRWWLPAGLAGGAAILSKYTGVLFFGGVLAALLSHPGLRPQLRSGWLWAGALAGSALGLTPIVLWNRAQGWPSFQHVGSLAGGDASRHSWASFPEFLGSQLGLVTPVLFVLIAGAWWRGRQAGRDADPRRWLLWCLGALPFLFFAALSLRTRVEGNWPAQAYLAGLLLLALDLDLDARVGRWAVGVALAFTLLTHVQAAWPYLPIPASRPQLDSASRVDGWRELASAVQSRRAALPAGSFVGCRTYQLAAELAFYLPDQPHPVILQKGPINHQYRFWNDPAAVRGRDAVLVVGQDWEANEMREAFTRLEEAGVFEHQRNGIVTQRVRILVGRGFRGLPGDGA